MRASEILTKVAEIVGGARNATHGEKERSFVCIGELWTVYLRNRPDANAPVSARDVSQMMVLLKIARSIQGEPVQDHFWDEAGYAAIAGELAELEGKG